MNLEGFSYGCLFGLVVAGIIIEKVGGRESPMKAIRIAMLVVAVISLAVGIYG
ncbi:hypothetical protein [Streptomyces sp. LN549]|uniref:hypothetical protein n=1 Tax=Streptomyces sp. LN549 TaxID=3112979 RepID=UPI00370FEFD5